MELQFEKKSVPYLQTVMRQVQTQEQTQEVRLTEGMPDIGRVVSAWGQVVLRGKEWHPERVGVNGGVMTWVLYVPEDEGTPQSVAVWIPFQMKWEIPQTRHDGTILAQPYLRSVDARSLSARKLMVRVNLGICAEAMAPAEAEVAYPGELPADIRLLKKVYPMCVPMEAGEKAFSMEETFSVGGVPPEQIVRCELRPQLAEWKLMTDKLVFRGNASVHALYRGEDGQLHSWDQEVPFSQYADLDKEFDDGCKIRMILPVTNLELDILPDKQLGLKAGIAGQYVICDETMVELVEDACSPERTVTVDTQMLTMPSILDEQNRTIRVEQSVENEGVSVADLAFYPDYPQRITTADRVQIQMPGAFSLLYKDEDGAYQSTNAYWEENMDVDVSPDAEVLVSVQPVGVPQAASGSGILMQADMICNVQTVNGQGIPMVTGLELGEQKVPDPARPSLVLRRAGEDDLWTIAKETGSAVELIQSANKLTGEPDPKQMLLIPIP